MERFQLLKYVFMIRQGHRYNVITMQLRSCANKATFSSLINE